jgi:hypothetical protein
MEERLRVAPLREGKPMTDVCREVRHFAQDRLQEPHWGARKIRELLVRRRTIWNKEARRAVTVLKYKDFQGSVSFEDGTVVLKILHIDDLIVAECDSASKVEQTFQELVDDYLETCAAAPRPMALTASSRKIG